MLDSGAELLGACTVLSTSGELEYVDPMLTNLPIVADLVVGHTELLSIFLDDMIFSIVLDLSDVMLLLLRTLPLRLVR